MIAPKNFVPGDDVAVIVARLEDFLAKYLADAGKLGIAVGAEQVAGAVDEAIRRCREKSPAVAGGKETVEAFFLDGISAALVEEQQGVYEKRKNEAGEEVFMVVSDEVWARCLTALRAAVERLV